MTMGVGIMPEFMDVHRGMTGLTADDLTAAHDADLAIQGEEDVVFKQAWADPESGVIYCLSEAPSAEAVQRIHERAGHPADEIHAVPLVV
ncbi:MAG TPA: SCO4226 family nickel-binding protein [Jatrophihabitantaceae bacterium]